MATDVKLPELGDGIEAGDVLSVLVKEGDTIKKNQSIVELETDKATVEVPSSHAGRVTKIHVREGQSVPIGGTLISVEPVGADAGGGGASEDASAKSQAAPSAAPQREPGTSQPGAGGATASGATPPPVDLPTEEDESEVAEAPAAARRPEKSAPAARSDNGGAAARKEKPAERSARPRAAVTVQAEAPAPSPPGRSTEVPIPAGPAVRRFSREVGVDLTNVQGSGPGGRITRDDVLQVVRQANQVARGGAPRPAPAAKDLPGESARDDWGPVRVERMTKIRRTIAAKMHESWSTVPRVTNFDDADITELERFRQASKDDYAEQGIKLTTMPFVIKAVATALKAHPVVNAALDEENGQIIYKQYVNIGIAVDSERGLVVPVVRDVDRLSIPEIAQALAEVAEKVRGGNFSVEDLRGGTFTISNLGAIGGTYSTPIINVPEVAILLTGRARKLPVVINDQVAIRLMMPLSLSYDHRLVDGATAARFLNDVMGYLRAPSRLLLAP